MPIFTLTNSAANKDMIGKMGIQISASVENIVGKGEIAHYEQFLLFPNVFESRLLLVLKRVSIE